MRAAKFFFLSVLVVSSIAMVPGRAQAGPGEYTLTGLAGPSFDLNAWRTQGRLGAEFNYDLGYAMGFGMMALFGISDAFRFQLMPLFRYDYFYLGPSSFYGVFGAGYGVYDKENAFDLRFGTGITLPLGDRWIFDSNVNLFVTPAGLARTVVTLDWLIGFGMKFH